MLISQDDVMTEIRALQRDLHVPLYIQIRDRLVADVEAGRLKPGDQFPSEPDLVAQFRVGRPTVRQALALLRQEGWAVTRRGSGTFVAGQRPRISLLDFDGLSRSLRARGFNVEDDILTEEETDRPPLDVLSIGEPGRWWKVTRLRFVVDGRDRFPLCIEADAFDLALCPDAAGLFRTTRSAAAVLEHGYGFGVRSCEVATRAIAADASAAKLLDVKRGSPLLAMERINSSSDGSTIHVVNYVMRTDSVPVVETLVNSAVPG
jgi:GntR family transcriptional regulator